MLVVCSHSEAFPDTACHLPGIQLCLMGSLLAPPCSGPALALLGPLFPWKHNVFPCFSQAARSLPVQPTGVLLFQLGCPDCLPGPFLGASSGDLESFPTKGRVTGPGNSLAQSQLTSALKLDSSQIEEEKLFMCLVDVLQLPTSGLPHTCGLALCHLYSLRASRS